MPLKPFKKTREFTFPGYDGSAWTGAQLDPLYTDYRIEYDAGYIYVYNTDDDNIFNIYSKGTRVDGTDPSIIYNQLRIVTWDFSGVSETIDIKLILKFNIGGSVIDQPIHIVINETRPTLTNDFDNIERPPAVDYVNFHFVAIETDGNQVDAAKYLEFITYDSAITIQVKYTYASGATAITDFTVMTVDSALSDLGAMPEDWLTFNVPMLG